MEFSSSSSDSDLEHELSRNFRRERREQRGIVRTASTTRTQAKVYTLPDGHSIEVRRGCIYIPSRDMYVHVLRAVSCPQRWFGDGRIPFRRRSPLSPNRIRLNRILSTTGTARLDGETSLAHATENEFFVFVDVQPQEGDKAPESSLSVACASPAKTNKRISDPLSDTRFMRVTQLSLWRSALRHPTALRAERHDVWNASEVTLSSHEVCCYDDELGFLWKFDGQDGSLYTLRFSQSAGTMLPAQLASIPFPPQSCLALHYVRGVQEATSFYSSKFYLIVVGVSHFAVVSLAVKQQQHSPWSDADPVVAVSQVQVVALRLSNVTCCGTRLASSPDALPELWFGAGRSVFKFRQQERGEWSKSRVTSFATTDVTALAVQEASACAPEFAVAGMRNGTLQLLTDDRRRHASFDTVVRHKGSDVRYLFMIPDVPYGFVSVARDGEAKVWDARALSRDREPVRVLLGARPDGGQAGVCSAALAHHVLAVSSASNGLRCIDLPFYNTLFHSDQNISPLTRLVCGAQNGGTAYELYTFSPYFTQRIALSI